MAFSVFLFPSTTFSQSEGDLILAAKTERKVVWYGSLNNEDLKRLAQAFEKKYPFLKVEKLRASGEGLVNRVLSEVGAGKYLFDVLAVGAFEICPAMKKGISGRYFSPHRLKRARGPGDIERTSRFGFPEHSSYNDRW